jgi:hypothetical protein
MANTSVWAKPDPDLAALRAQMASPEPAPTVWAPMDDSAPRALPAQPAPHVIWAPPHTAQDDAMNAQPVNMPDTGANLHAGLEKVFPPAQPQVALDPNPQHQIEGHLTNRLQQEYAKDAPWNPDDHGTMGKIGHVFSKIGGGLADTFLPGVVPGTSTYRHDTENNIAHELNSTIGEESQSALHGATTEYTEQKPEIEKTRLQQQNNIASSKNASVLEKAGYKQDDDGTIVPMDYDEMSPAQQSSYDLKNAQRQLAVTTMGLRDAQTDFEKMRGDPNSVQNQQIAQRLQVAKQAQDRMTGMMGAMQERADAQMINAKAGAYGVGMDNQPLPGAMLTEQGQPVGSHFQANVRPTGTQRAKGNMAESADQQINDMKGIIDKRSDIFGPAAGRTTDFTVWLGSQDPDAQRFRAARTIAGDHLAGTFGGRSEAALSALDSAIGHFKDNPKAVAAGLDQLQEANHLFLKAGKVHTVGGNNSESAPQGVPKGATHTVPGSDGKMHYTDGKNDLGVVK